MPDTRTSRATDNPCLDCGACCASFRVSFYWSEATDLPETLIEQVTPFFACMAGTNGAAPHCNALQGVVGQQVACRVYAQRPPACREVEAGDDKCNRARSRYGLESLPRQEKEASSVA
ncbi:YkgJ family cysteine cluster protein [Niveibacterium sp.]|uniref:YkgJ family cysteine cluster protein n=1 Tax=Niveibacterium sp. TaxID=2017444 RepID=UPI0035B4C651